MICTRLAALAAALAFATSAAAAPCATSGEKSGRPLKLDYKKDMVGYVSWAYALDPVMSGAVLALAKPDVTCERGQFQAGGETYTLTGENEDLFPRRIIPSSPGKPALYLAPVRDLTKTAGGALGVKVRYTPGASYALIRLDERTATAVRIYKKIPTDDLLIQDLVRVIETGGQAVAMMQRPDGEVGIVVSPTID
jgi:hypothetical protein